MVTPEQLERSKAIQQRTGLTFHVATRLLPERVRHPTYVLYAFFRVADDVVDDPDPGPASAQRRRLEAMRAVALGDEAAESIVDAGDDGETAAVLRAFARLRDEHDIGDAEVDAFIDAMGRDVEASDYDAYADLASYLRGSSVAVGNMMLSVMGASDEAAARPHARALAEAFQLTNFLRDVREDVTEYDRVYLPRASLAAHNATPADVRALEATPGLRRTVRDELRRTESLYREGVAGIRYLPEDCQPAVLLAAVLYADHHRCIRGRGFDVFSDRPELTVRRRLWLAARTWLAWRRTRDPAAVFYRVSAVDSEPGPVEAVRQAASAENARRESAPTPRIEPVRRLLASVPWRGD